MRSLSCPCSIWLMSTISAAALLTPQCQSPYNEETGIVDLDPARKICSQLMVADIIAWSVSMSIELVSVVTGMMVLAMCTMLDEDTYKVWLVRNWRKAQLPVFLAVMGLCIAFPIAIALRVWLIVPHNIAGIITAIFFVAFWIAVNVFWVSISNAAYGLMPRGPAYSPKQNNKINDGWLGQQKLRFEQALSAPELSDRQKAGLFFDFGRAQAALGESDAAYNSFDRVRGLDPGFAGLDDQVASLPPRTPGSEEVEEKFEDFEDLMAEFKDDEAP